MIVRKILIFSCLKQQQGEIHDGAASSLPVTSRTVNERNQRPFGCSY